MEKTSETTTEVSIIEKLNANNLPELIGWKEKQETLVTENPFVEITDSKTYDLACKSRTNLLKGRTELEKQEKEIASKVAAFRKAIGGKTAELIEITLPAEQKQQSEVKRWEAVKELEKAEKERLENERIDAIKNKAVELESSALEVIQKMTYSGIIVDSAKVSAIMETDFDFEEYDILYSNANSRVLTALEEKVKDLMERENFRIEKEKAEEKAKEEKAKSDLQAKRLNELLPYNGYGADVDMATLWNLTEEHYSKVLESKKSIKDSFDAEQKRIQEKEESDKKAQEEKSKKEKDAIFEIRKNRMIEIGFVLNEENVFTHPDLFAGIASETILESDVIEFENIISDAKKSIQKSKHDAIELARQKEADEKASKADAAKLKAENKARVKKFAKDKKTLSGLIATVDYPDTVFVLENEESEEALKAFVGALDDFKKEWIGNIEKL